MPTFMHSVRLHAHEYPGYEPVFEAYWLILAVALIFQSWQKGGEANRREPKWPHFQKPTFRN